MAGEPDETGTPHTAGLSATMRRVDTFFKISERGSTVGREIRGGVVTFFTMAYIIVLNPLIIGFAKDANGHFLGGSSPGNLAVIAAGTALVVGVMSIVMGLVWIGIPAKGLLLDSKKGQQLANECKNAEQMKAAAAPAANPTVAAAPQQN